MQSFTVIQVSDSHLSRSHAYFQDNWESSLEHIAARTPALVIHTGDVAFNAPDHPDDLVFCREQLDRLPGPWVAIPGNHDIGEPGENPRLGQYIGETDLTRWEDCFGADSFCRDIGVWRLIGINSELLGSGLPQEEVQWQFLADALDSGESQEIGLFLHKPLFMGNMDATQINGACVHPAPRRRLRDLLSRPHVRFISCGHTHAYHRSIWNGVDVVWCPTTAFINPDKRWPVDAVNRAGLIEWTFEGRRVSHQVVEPVQFVNMDMTNWTRLSGTTITLPPLPHRPRSVP